MVFQVEDVLLVICKSIQEISSDFYYECDHLVHEYFKSVWMLMIDQYMLPDKVCHSACE